MGEARTFSKFKMRFIIGPSSFCFSLHSLRRGFDAREGVGQALSTAAATTSIWSIETRLSFSSTLLLLTFFFLFPNLM